MSYWLTHSRMSRGGLQAPKIWATWIFWAAREIWAKPIFKEVCMCVCVFFFSKRDISYFKLVSVVKPVKFTRDSGCLARDEFLAIIKGDHILIYLYICDPSHKKGADGFHWKPWIFFTVSVREFQFSRRKTSWSLYDRKLSLVAWN